MKTTILAFLAMAFLSLCASGANAAQPGIRCVQNQLNELGFDAGSADGSYGAMTRSAADGYNNWISLKDPALVLPPLTKSNGQLWCESIAKANPQVAKYNVSETPTTLLIQFRGNVPSKLTIRVSTERANTPDCNSGPCTIDPLKKLTLKADANGLIAFSLPIPPRATRACVQATDSRTFIDKSELYLNSGAKRESAKGGDLEANGKSACSFSGADAKLANTWVLTLK